MAQKRTLPFVALLAFLTLFVSATRASIRIELLSEVTTRSDVVKLSTCLPASAPPAVRDSAESIVLGNAPRAGSQRTFGRNEILRAVSGSPNLRSILDVPPSITITRWSRLITREEILAAIEKTLKANDLAVPGGLSAGDLSLVAPVAVTEAVPQLSVTRFEPDGASGKTRVALWTISEPRTPPFWVTLDRAIGVPMQDHAERADYSAAPAQRQSGETRSSSTGENVLPLKHGTVLEGRLGEEGSPAVRLTKPNGPLLVHAGKAVHLIVQGRGMRIAAFAIALETGREGEQVRVQCTTSGKILAATVIAADTAQISY